MTIYNTIGVNNFTRCNFSNNRRSSDPYAYPGGGGVYIEFSYCLPGDNAVLMAQKIPTLKTIKTRPICLQNVRLLITKLSLVQLMHLSWSPTTRTIWPLAEVAACRFFQCNSSNNTFNISNCTFLNNTAMWVLECL